MDMRFVSSVLLFSVNTYLEHMSWNTGERAERVEKFMKDVAQITGSIIIIR